MISSSYLVSLSVIVFALLQPSTLAHSHVHAYNHDDISRDLVGLDRTRSICGTHDPSVEEVNEADEVVRKWRHRLGRIQMRTGDIDPIVIRIAFHVIISKGHGNLKDKKVKEQVDVLNRAYSPHFEFQLINTTYSKNDLWFSNNDSELKMKKSLRQGGCETLNVYSNSGYGYLGFANFPNSCARYPFLDGAVINFDTLPGGPLGNFDGGDTLTHEVGHWLGLYHTFQGDIEGDGCEGSGDHVDDTPIHRRNFSCDEGQNTCDNTEETDPLNNFMNYTPDSCMQSFTPGQFERMVWHWNEYRKPAKTIVPTAPPSSTPAPPAPSFSCELSDTQFKFQAEIHSTNGCGTDVIFILQKKKKGKSKKKNKKKQQYKPIKKVTEFDKNGLMNIQQCLLKKPESCYRYKLIDSSRNVCTVAGNVGVTIIVDDVTSTKGSKRKKNPIIGSFGDGCWKKKKD